MITKKLLLLFAAVCFTLLAQAQQTLKQTELNFDLEKKIIRLEPAEISLKDGSLLKEGKYIVDFNARSTTGNIKAVLYVNMNGKIDGPMAIENVHDHIAITATFRNGVPLSFAKRTQGKLADSAYKVSDTFYELEFDNDGHFKRETRSYQGNVIYTKSLNDSGIEIEDKLKGTTTIYEGKANVIRNRSSSKNLPAGVKRIEEAFENGKLVSKQFFYQNDDKKILHPDGSYEIENNNAQLKSYSQTGKLLKTTNLHYPVGLPQVQN
jgi:hypothetical protein